MVDWSNATGMQLDVLQDALLAGFPTPADFETFLYLRLNKDYQQLAGYLLPYRNGLVQLLRQAKAEGWIDQLVTQAQIVRPQQSRIKALRFLTDLTTTAPVGGRTLEDIVRQDGGFQDVIPWIRLLDRLTAQICRVECPINQGVGTAWLVAPNLLLTNGHVAAPFLEGARQASDYAVRFDYAMDTSGTNAGVTFRLAATPCLSWSPASPLELGTGNDGPAAQYLDYALLQLAENVGDGVGPNGQKRGWIATKLQTPAPADNSVVMIMQHPSGDPLKLDMGVALGTIGDGTRVQHDVNTKTGSSGSPCLDVRLTLVALHNAGDPMYDGVHGAARANHAVPIAPILARLDTEPVAKFWS